MASTRWRTFWLEELGALLVRLCLLLARPVEDVLCAEHGEDGEDLIAAAEVHTGNQHLQEGDRVCIKCRVSVTKSP